MALGGPPASHSRQPAPLNHSLIMGFKPSWHSTRTQRITLLHQEYPSQERMAQVEPSAEALQTTINLLTVLRDPTNPQYGEAQRYLDSHVAEPALILSLAFILARTTADHVTNDVRQLAGLLLKNYVIYNTEKFMAAGVELQAYIKHHALLAAQDGNEQVRNIAGILITTLAANYVEQAASSPPHATGSGTTTAGSDGGGGGGGGGGGLNRFWPELLPALLEMLTSQQLHRIEGAFSCLLKILEDSGRDLQQDPVGQHFVNQFVAVFLTFFTCQDDKIRASAVRAMNYLIFLKPTELTANIEVFISRLALLKDDRFYTVRQGVCQALRFLFKDGNPHLIAKLPEIMDFMLAKCQDPDERVALEACEFWHVFSEYDEQHKHVHDLLSNYLPRLIPVLLMGMVYSKGERESFECENKLELDTVPDRAQDIKPMHFHSRANHSSDDNHDDGGEDEEDMGDGNSNGGEVLQWNLRRCSAAAIDTLSELFGSDALLPILLPLLYDRLQHGDVWEREASILALGAIAWGCVKGMQDQLPRLFPYLLEQLTKPEGESTPQLRCTVVWTLSRYTLWVLEQNNDATYLMPMVERILITTLDHNKKVQQAACSAFATIEEEAGPRLVPCLEPILQYLSEAMDRYQTRSLIVLYDAVGTLADSIKGDICRPDFLNVLMPKLFARFKALPDHDRILCYLLECFTSIAPALGVQLQPWAPALYARCLQLIQMTLVAEADKGKTGQEPDKDFAVCALDLLTGMAEGLGPSFEALVGPGGEVFGLVYGCMQDRSEEVRQSAFALVGDVAKACHHRLVPFLADYMGVLVHNLEPKAHSVCNNASWAIGEITIKAGAELMLPLLPAIMSRLVPIVNDPLVHRSLLENTAITIGRLAKTCPQVMAPGLRSFLHAWCVSLQNIKHRGEKEHAFEGLCFLLQQNPTVLIDADGSNDTFEAFAWAVASWYDHDTGLPSAPDRLQHMFKVILQYVRDMVKTQRDWNEYLGELDPHLVQYFVTFYEL